VHRLDPRTKLLSVIVFIAALFLAKSFVSYGLMLLVLSLCVGLSRIRPAALLRGLKPLIFILLLTGILNLFYTPGRTLAEFWIFRITYEGVRNAVFMLLRIMMLVCGTFLLTYTNVAPVPHSDGMESCLSPEKNPRARPRAVHR
jgi:energy-coupling factor transport system permease protein